jgi:hypothetical protein
MMGRTETVPLASTFATVPDDGKDRDRAAGQHIRYSEPQAMVALEMTELMRKHCLWDGGRIYQA